MRGRIDVVNVKTSKPKKSYGFIAGEDGKMYFFLLNDLRDAKVGDDVQFEGEKDDKGYIATWVQAICKTAVH